MADLHKQNEEIIKLLKEIRDNTSIQPHKKKGIIERVFNKKDNGS